MHILSLSCTEHVPQNMSTFYWIPELDTHLLFCTEERCKERCSTTNMVAADGRIYFGLPDLQGFSPATAGCKLLHRLPGWGLPSFPFLTKLLHSHWVLSLIESYHGKRKDCTGVTGIVPKPNYTHTNNGVVHIQKDAGQGFLVTSKYGKRWGFERSSRSPMLPLGFCYVAFPELPSPNQHWERTTFIMACSLENKDPCSRNHNGIDCESIILCQNPVPKSRPVLIHVHGNSRL